MNSSKNKQLKTLKSIAEENNFSVSFLNEKIKQGLLKFEKKGKAIYSTQEWLDEFKTNFTFSGFMFNKFLDSNTPKKNTAISKPVEIKTNNKKNTKQLGEIIQEKELKIDLEEIFVKKWNNEFKKIHNNFKEQIVANGTSKKPHSSKDYNIQIAIISVAIMFVISLYTVILLPGVSDTFTRKMDSFINSPYEKLNQIALKTIEEKSIYPDNKNITSKDLASYIKENASTISYPGGTIVDVREDEILGRVAGVEESFGKTEAGFFQKIKNSTVEIFQKLSDKQKRASLKLSDELNKLISE